MKTEKEIIKELMLHLDSMIQMFGPLAETNDEDKQVNESITLIKELEKQGYKI